MAQFNGRLNPNEAYLSLYNAYRFVTTFADNLNGLDNTLASKFKMDGGAYNDQSVWTVADVLTSRDWDPTDTNVLATEQMADPKQQKITTDKMRQIAMTIPANQLTKRAWMEPGAFEAFQSVVEALVSDTKKLYEQRLVDTTIGTMEAEMPSGKGAGQAQTVLIAGTDTEDMKVRKIGKKIADILVDVKDSTRDFNDYGNMTAIDKKDMMIVYSSSYLNNFSKISLPVVFHQENIIDFDQDQLPGRYFGTKITESNYSTYSASNPTAGKPINSGNGTYVPGSGHANGYLRSLKEQDVTVSGTTTHLFPGDEIPSGAVVYDSTAEAGSKIKVPCYIVDPKIICKIMHKDSIKYLSGFESRTEFYNPKNLSRNLYETWCFSEPDYLRAKPLITLREVNS